MASEIFSHLTEECAAEALGTGNSQNQFPKGGSYTGTMRPGGS